MGDHFKPHLKPGDPIDTINPNIGAPQDKTLGDGSKLGEARKATPEMLKRLKDTATASFTPEEFKKFQMGGGSIQDIANKGARERMKNAEEATQKEKKKETKRRRRKSRKSTKSEL